MDYSLAAHGGTGAQSRISAVSYGKFVMELRGSVGVLIFSPMLILGTEFLPVNCWGSLHWLTNVGEALPRISGCIMLLSSFQ